ncbi:hypothetical protein J2Y45_000501 [Dyadobacter sp. BE34]|uniref:DUF3800 domain-containing protein n=1 Tax=Dyadobacter fermentans TaxID=94254 RepID=A0ABU1QPZ7_9BACT|nr:MULTISPECIES: DUF3800 domain-containing protein [Dyadobacter]MDR6803231.1 hypothetical protein [Dyadobacter fermentans]MDR7040972.1 hypothetical protein [Dyadobacter sp. BE242]MDR7195375.1 hypothetical protein [Dyadobacter sp. BE34]MDR7214080.1 hypothetical protein [Dyadobacter sp. BE31]MDR7260782.1 hypothetical protein [Dyadobacter sp. BE32]
MSTIILPTFKRHRFLDEAGDTTFYGKGKVPIVGQQGVSKCFILGMLKINEPLEKVREKILSLQEAIEKDPYFGQVSSIEKRKAKGGFYIHAKEDIPEIRRMAFQLIKTINCRFEAIVARKMYVVYERKHNGTEAEFYADLLSHLLKNKLNKYDKLVLNIAKRSKCTTHANLQKGLNKSVERSIMRNPVGANDCEVVFNVQAPTSEPILNIADYFCWAIQRVFEKGETRFYDFISDKISQVIDVYDFDNFRQPKGKSGAHYGKRRKLTSENLVQ